MVPAFAEEAPASSEPPDSSAVVEDEAGEDEVVEPEPSPVYIVSDDVDVSEFLASPETYDVYSVDTAATYALPSGDDFPFFGSNWAIGTASGLGECKLFWPSDRGEGYIGLDASGNLYNVSATSITGVLYDGSGIAYTVSFGSFSLPRYRLASGSSYTYEDLYFVPSETSMVLPDSPSPAYSVSDLLPWVSLLLLGGIWLCCMRK